MKTALILSLTLLGAVALAQDISTFRMLLQPSPAAGFAKDIPPFKVWVSGDGRGNTLRDADLWHIYREHMAMMPDADGVSLDKGQTFCERREILLAVEQSDSEMRDSLVHELLHAITRCEVGNLNSSDNRRHEGIYWLAPRLAWVWAHNPAVAAYLHGASLALKP